MAARAAEPVGAAGLAGEAALGDRIRAFFALPVPDPQREQLSGYLASCAAVAPDFRWAVHDNLHITLRFVGSVERRAVEEVASHAEAGVGGPFELALGDVGTFGSGPRVRVVWLGLSAGADPVRRLAGVLERECRAAGLEPEARAFKPHLTLARAKPRDGAGLPELPRRPVLEPWKATEVILFSSHLGRGGAVHEPIRSVPLAE